MGLPLCCSPIKGSHRNHRADQSKEYAGRPVTIHHENFVSAPGSAAASGADDEREPNAYSTPPPPVIFRKYLRRASAISLLNLSDTATGPCLRAGLAALFLLVLLLSITPVSAETFTASSHATLVSAINSANGNSEADTINITADITLTADLPAITSEITINGNGYEVSGADAHAMFNVTGSLSARDIIISNGLAITPNPNGRDGYGGCILFNNASGTLRLNRVIVRSCRSQGLLKGGGGIYVQSGEFIMDRSAVYDNTSEGQGGGILVDSNSRIRNSSIYNNTARAGGGLFVGENCCPTSITLEHVTVTGNRSTPLNIRHGIIIHSAGNQAVTIRNSIIYGNSDTDCRAGRSGEGSVFNLAASRGNIIGPVTVGDCEALRNNNNNDDPLLSSSATTDDGPPYYALMSGSPAINAATCIPGVSVDQRGVSRGCRCDIGAFEFDMTPCPAAVSAGGARVAPATTCETLPATIVVSNRSADTACQRVSGAGIGVASLVEGGAREAVDVWNAVAPDTKVCFAAAGGSIQFLDAAGMPRRSEPLMAYREGAMLCANIDRPGTAVLMPGPMVAEASAVTAAADETIVAGSNCMVTTRAGLIFRDGPAGQGQGVVPEAVTLTVLERTSNWYKVDYHGAQGWISAAWVTPNAACA